MSNLAQLTFGERLCDAVNKYGPVCAGIDPHPHLLRAWGLDTTPEGLDTFTNRCVEAFVDAAAIVKPQIAFFEAYGSAGLRVYEEACRRLRQAGTLVLADAKRGDIGSTMAAYAQAWLAPGSPLEADAVTVSPYLGFGSLQEAVSLAQTHGKGVFVLAATSNPDGPSIQHAVDTNGTRLDAQIVAHVANANAEAARHGQLGAIGIVLGATVADPPALTNLNGPVLMPGVGAQGATFADVAQLTANVEALALPSLSRSLLQSGPAVADLRKAVWLANEQACATAGVSNQ
ncbi:orotidine-5'-phosphate decarboxylase [Corynebacterium choanae]|uniref:Orotidine-5'-phosphate decarboxylase n=1 Tax=Corynebacterium choanae TaxID=1862358 RepID=A0A3G6J6S2_9CORY|nr:orotidine-5'-phosphate decarboxylase [Corynebacterium choanae]AZA13656.1 orotidine 5'-phosphate decarboxylase [Corynebacterium choanae]